jgi:hypothetical protein
MVYARTFRVLGIISLFSLQSIASPVKALSIDLERIITAIESDEWFMDHKGYDEALSQFMPSVCRAPASVLNELSIQLEKEVLKSGDAKELFEKTGLMSEKIELAMHASRKRETLLKAIDQKSECPFWISEQKPFKSRQSGVGRFLWSAESGGMLQLRVGSGDVKTGGGGAARILGNYGYTPKVSLLGGFDFGGGAFVKPTNPEEDVDVRFFPAAPIIVRLHHGAWHGDLELALASTFSADKIDPVLGWRIGGAIGFSTLRMRNFLPWGGLAFAIEQYPASKDQDGLFLRMGFRAGTLFME